MTPSMNTSTHDAREKSSGIRQSSPLASDPAPAGLRKSHTILSQPKSEPFDPAAFSRALNSYAYSFCKLIYESKVPIHFRLSRDELLKSEDSSLSYYVLAPRCSYLSLYTDPIKTYLVNYVNSLPEISVNYMTIRQDQEVWLSYKGIPLKWHYPIGLLYDIFNPRGLGLSSDPFYKSDASLAATGNAWTLDVHFNMFPDDKILHCDNDKKMVCSHLISCLKESDYLKYPKKPKMQKLHDKDPHVLWESLLRNNFGASWHLNESLMGDLHPASFKYLPFKMYLMDGYLLMDEDNVSVYLASLPSYFIDPATQKPVFNFENIKKCLSPYKARLRPPFSSEQLVTLANQPVSMMSLNVSNPSMSQEGDQGGREVNNNEAGVASCASSSSSSNVQHQLNPILIANPDLHSEESIEDYSFTVMTNRFSPFVLMSEDATVPVRTKTLMDLLEEALDLELCHHTHTANGPHGGHINPCMHAELVVHGIRPPLNTDALWAYRRLAYPDGFLHLKVTRIVKISAI